MTAVPSSPKIYTYLNLSAQQSHMWSSRQIEDEVALCDRRNLLAVFHRFLSDDQRILEAGCGLCAWLIRLNQFGYRVEGIDFDPLVVKRVKEFNPELDVAVKDVVDTHYDSEAFDGYISLGVVEHFETGPQGALAEAFRILRPGGTMILTVPFNNMFRRLLYNQLRKVFMLLLKLKKKPVFFAEYRFDSAEILNYVRTAQFEVIETGYDDFSARSESLGLWTDWPFLRSEGQFKLNPVGRLIALCAPKRLHASGMYVVARKPAIGASSPHSRVEL